MPSSDSEDFESADEGRSTPNKKERKKRLSSSNYSDNFESDKDIKKVSTKSTSANKQDKFGDGWDDFDIVEEDALPNSNISNTKEDKSVAKSNKQDKASSEKQHSAWDDFDDWGDESSTGTSTNKEPLKSQININPQPAKSESWGWGWGVDSLLSTATAGISTLTTQVSQGITTVLETGIGAPDPEELARKSCQSNETKQIMPEKEQDTQEKQDNGDSNDGTFPFGSLLSGVTKFVETTSTKVIAGGLDTLETIGKKTMEVLQDGDPGLAKKRAMLGLDSGDRPILSQLLREAKEKADEEDIIREAKKEAKEVHYETLFDDFEGLVHLEALEMLSKQVNMRIDERFRSADPDKRQDIKETLQQVAELCEMPDDDEDDDIDENISQDISKSDALLERLQKATRDIGLKLQFQPLIKQYTEIINWLETQDNITEKLIYKKAVSSLAQATALSVELYHKTGEMLLVKTRRSTADEADALTQMTVVISKHISELATQFSDKLRTLSSSNEEQINNYMTNIFLEAENSSKYVENAFQLALPIVQIGAV